MATAAVSSPTPIPTYTPQATQSVQEPKSSERQDVQTVLNYHKPNEDGSPPHPTYVDRPETYDRPFESHPATVKDVRGRENEFSLDTTGFQFYKHASIEKDFTDDEQIKDQYYKETAQLLKDASVHKPPRTTHPLTHPSTGATRVHIFDHTIRRQPPGAPSQSRQLRGPVQRVHIDQSYSAALSRVPFHLPADADTLQQSRVQIINVWRPIKTVLRDPLAVADAHSVSDDSLVVTELIYPTRRGETYAVKHDAAHR